MEKTISAALVTPQWPKAIQMVVALRKLGICQMSRQSSPRKIFTIGPETPIYMEYSSELLYEAREDYRSDSVFFISSVPSQNIEVPHT